MEVLSLEKFGQLSASFGIAFVFQSHLMKFMFFPFQDFSILEQSLNHSIYLLFIGVLDFDLFMLKLFAETIR
jgi:hypothetical protein